MNPTDALRSRRRLIAVIATTAIVVLLAGVGVYGLLSGPRTGGDPAPSSTPSPSSQTDESPAPRELAPIPETDDPEAFARHVAGALFGWDTTSGLMPLDYTSVLLAVADPSGIEQAGLASDIAGYLPTRETWVELRQYSTTQRLEITSVFVPEAWAEAEAQAQPGQLQPGTTAYTIEGVRHRAGIWNDEPTASEHEVAFTMFLTCPPDGDPCYLLRLSVLDQPLR
ncbi:hypothetical protein ACTXKH_07710 [Brachybacterium tyrofermentans]|uniref:hypothetical protein n=1 Tax=Brachybacterium tyrofermentans TaxID=47848 RepID=UPI003F915075